MAVATALALGDILEFVVNCHANGQDGDNVTFWEVTGLAGTGTSLEVALLTFADLVDSLYADAMSTLAEFRGARGRRIFPLPKSYTVPLTGTQLAGALAGRMLPTQCRGLITRFNSLGGPKNRARMYVPFTTADSLSSDGGVTLAYATLLDALGSAYTTPLLCGSGGNTATLTPRGLTRSAVPLSSGLHPLVAWHSSNEFATQKSSGAFGRPNP